MISVGEVITGNSTGVDVMLNGPGARGRRNRSLLPGPKMATTFLEGVTDWNREVYEVHSSTQV